MPGLPVLPGVSVSSLLDAMLGWVATVLLGALRLMWALASGFALTSPDVTALPQVQQAASRSLWVVNTVYVLAVLAAAVLVMARETVQVRYGIGDLAPRLLVGLVAANAAMPLCRGLTVTANAFTAALTGDSITTAGSLKQLTGMLSTSGAGGNGPAQVLWTVLLVLLLVLTVALAFGWLVRIGLLVVLVGIAPLALACHGLPATEPVARLWWRSMLAALGVVVVQAFALHTTLSVFLSPEANLPALGIPLDPGGTLNLLIVVCLLWTTVRVPALARRFVTGARPSPVATLVRVVVVQQLTRGLVRFAGAGAARGGRAVARLVR